MLGASMLQEFVPQFFRHSVEHCKRPASFEDVLWRFVVGRLALVALFAGREFERHDCSTAAFVRAPAVFFVGHEEFQGSQNKGPETSLLLVSAIEISAFYDAHEEVLREVLRPIGRITAPPQIGIQWIPVALTQRHQCGASFLPMWMARSDHQCPPCGWKLRR